MSVKIKKGDTVKVIAGKDMLFVFAHVALQ